MSTGSPQQRPPLLTRGGPWLMVFLIAAVAVLITWLMLSLLSGSEPLEEAGLTPGASAEQTEVPPPSATPATVPVTPPAATTPAEPDLVDRFRLGQRQGHDTANDDRRVAFGEIGPHCFVGEECGEVPAGAAAVNEAAAGTAGIGGSGSGTGGIDFGALVGGGSSGSGESGSGSGTSADSAAGGGGASTARRVPQGQVGPHCFVGEDCPPVPGASSGGTGDGSRTLSGPVVQCGALGVHSRVGESTPCVNGVISRVGTGVATLPSGTTIGRRGRCYMVTEQTATSATVIEIACPASGALPVPETSGLPPARPVTGTVTVD